MPLAASTQFPADEDRQYSHLLHRQGEHFAALLGSREGKTPLFTTEVPDLFGIFLEHLPGEARQRYTCNACRRFVEQYGGLCTISEKGSLTPVCWTEERVPDLFLDSRPAAGCLAGKLLPPVSSPSVCIQGNFFRPAVQAMIQAVRRARVTGVFLSAQPLWGKPEAGGWTHFSVRPPESALFRHPLQTAEQAMAEKREDYRILTQALADFSPDQVAQAVRLLEGDALYRGEKVLGPARWLQDLMKRRAAAKGAAREHLTWRAVATAPAGFCHPRSSMIGTLLEDIAAGLPYREVEARFREKMHPLQYQRPQAAPAAGNIAQAEQVFARLGLAPSLERRYARLEDLETLWRPQPAEAEQPGTGTGLFGHLLPKQAQGKSKTLEVPERTMTWDKFRRTVLPRAEALEFFVPAGHGNYAALVTAVHPDAPPLLQWDRPERRNPVNWYVYVGGSSPDQWGLKSGRYCPVTAVSLQPTLWGDENAFRHQGQSVFFLLEGARDSRDAGLCLFPEVLRSELHGVRATIEAHSKSGKLTGREEATACGIRLQGGATWEARFRVKEQGVLQEYRLDRWD